MKAWMSGSVAGTGTFRCTDCDFPVSLDAADELPTCPNCGGTEFVRASLFTTSQQAVVDLGPEVEDHAWLEELRDGLEEPGQYLAYRSGDDVVAYALAARVDADRPQPGCRHPLRRPDGLAAGTR